MAGSGGSPAKSTVKVEQVELPSVGTVANVRRLSGEQRAALWLAIGVGVVGAAVTIAIAVAALIGAPRLTSLPGNLDSAAATTAIENHQALAEAAALQSTAIFEQVVVQALIPLFTLLLGYLFGRQEAAKQE